MQRKINTGYGKANLYSVENYSPEAEQVLVVPGFSETIAHNKEVVDAISKVGFDAATFSQPRRLEKKDERHKEPISRLGGVVIEMAKAVSERGEKIHAVAHSMGTAATLRAAQEAPELFASVTLMQPLGMDGPQSLGEMAGRVNKKVMQNQLGALRSQDPTKQEKVTKKQLKAFRNDDPTKQDDEVYVASVDTESAAKHSARVAKAQLTGGNVLASQPALAFKEASAAGSYSMADDIAKVTELGIPVHIVTAHSDELFDQDKVNAGYEANQAYMNATSYSTVADPDARHDTFWMQPERSANIVRQVINEKR